MDQITFKRPLTTENKAIQYVAGINLLFVLAIILVILINPESKWGILFGLGLIPVLLNLGLGAYLYRRYHDNPQVKGKSQAKEKFLEEQRNLEEIESRIETIERRRKEIKVYETNQLKIKQSNHDNFTRYLENRLHMSDTDHRRRLSIALSDLQQEFITSGLSDNAIEAANIPGLDDRLLDRLSKQGITTANDVSMERLSKVRGLGRIETESLLLWRKELETDLDEHKPAELPPDLQEKIEEKAQAQERDLESQMAHLNETLETNLVEIRATAQKELEDIDKEDTEAPGLKQQTLNSIKLAQDEINRYRRITPLNYIKSILSFEGGLPQNSKQWLAMGAGLFLVLSCLFIGVFGLMSSSQVAVAMLITDTPTITLTPTASNTPTITLTPTSSPTETPTRTDTPTNTLTPSNTPSPSATLTLAISLTPSNTPIPSVTLPEMDVMGCIPAENERIVGIVTRIIDGDTIVVTYDGQDHIVHYIGIDAPAKDAPYGEYAASENAKIALWETVTLVMDSTDMDDEDRLLRYVIAGDRFVNLELLRIGASVLNLVEPDVACSAAFEAAQSEAQGANLGIWLLTPSP